MNRVFYAEALDSPFSTSFGCCFQLLKGRGNKRRGKAAENSILLPFPQSHLISRKYNQAGALPTAASANRIVQLFLGIPLPAESVQSQHLALEERLGSIPQIEGAAILRIRAPFPRPQLWVRLEEGVHRKKKRKKENRRGERRKPDVSYGEKVNIAGIRNEKGGYSPASLSDS